MSATLDRQPERSGPLPIGLVQKRGIFSISSDRVLGLGAQRHLLAGSGMNGHVIHYLPVNSIIDSLD
jgi:hypothetical protein